VNLHRLPDVFSGRNKQRAVPAVRSLDVEFLINGTARWLFRLTMFWLYHRMLKKVGSALPGSLCCLLS